jgi:murein DD-endopeptidase MepM/ murein hydrolase activator NlpD
MLVTRQIDWKQIATAVLLPLSLFACADIDDRSTQLDWPLNVASRNTSATYYTVPVRPGDTLSAIAQRYAVSTRSIAALNGISNHDSIYAGQVLKIPAGSRATRDAVYADATSRPSRANPYIPAPEPRRGGYPDATRTGQITSKPLPPVGRNAPSQQAQTRSTPAWYAPQAAQPAQAKPRPQVHPAPDVQVAQTVPGLPRFGWPVSGKVISDFGSSSNGETNDGINISAGAGEPIRAAASGTVTYAGNQLRSYGNLLFIKHETDTSRPMPTHRTSSCRRATVC